MTPTTAWHGNPALKTQAVAAMTTHRAAEEFIQGNYADIDSSAAAGYRGCFHGCLTVDKLAAEAGISAVEFIRRRASATQWWEEGERLWGIPATVGRVLDWAFEEVPASQAAGFAVAATAAIPVGADLSLVLSRWLLDILADPDHGVWIFAAAEPGQGAAVEAVIALHRRRLVGDEPAAEEWREARRAAGITATGQAAAAAAAVDGRAAIAASYAATAVSARVNTWDDARQAHCRWMIDRLLAHLSEAPVPAVAA